MEADASTFEVFVEKKCRHMRKIKIMFIFTILVLI